MGENISPEAIVKILSHPEGGLKNIPSSARSTLLLHQANTSLLQSTGGKIAQSLLNSYDSVLVGSFQQNQPESFQIPSLLVFEKIAGIILAAGESKRFGQPKQLLDWRGRPFVRAVAQTALAAGLTPVLVITGANAVQVESVIKDLNVRIIRNEQWQKGQSTSIKAGILSLPPSTFGREGVGAAIFLLADQPHIGADVIRALVEHHTVELSPIIAPLVLEEQRANPVLFDDVTFSDLLELEGDIGGRALFSKYKVEYMPWHDDRLLLDVDNPEDYQRLVEDETI
jgi:molybdenum cofactor cytidylyltransferase